MQIFTLLDERLPILIADGLLIEKLNPPTKKGNRTRLHGLPADIRRLEG